MQRLPIMGQRETASFDHSRDTQDRKSTRLNSSHSQISYAVFCLKNKQTVISGRDLDALPDDPDELAAALQALAGPSIGPNGGQIFIDGLSCGTMPPKESIREIRINQNPFSAETISRPRA